MRLIILCIYVLFPTIVFCQARIVLNNNAYIVMNNNAYLVVDNGNSNAINTAGTGGNIISESEFNFVRWNIGTNTGNYVIPFTTASSVKIPTSLNITSAATGSGHFLFSTYGGPTWDNNNYKPTGVTNMTNMGGINNSSEVIDRFWIIDALGYTTKPSGNIQFNYNDAEHLTAGNTINEADLKAERYDEATDNWELYAPGGIVNTTLNSVAGVPFTSSDLTRSWTLIDQTSHLLPIILSNISAECEENKVVIRWQTEQEINTTFFVLKGSNDGFDFYELTTIEAAGNTTSTTDYSFVVENNFNAYYQLSLIEEGGISQIISTFPINCNSGEEIYVNAYVSGAKQITLQISGLNAGEYNLQLFDITGRTIVKQPLSIENYFNQFIIEDNNLTTGIYVLYLTSLDKNTAFKFSKKISLIYQNR